MGVVVRRRPRSARHPGAREALGPTRAGRPCRAPLGREVPRAGSGGESGQPEAAPGSGSAEGGAPVTAAEDYEFARIGSVSLRLDLHRSAEADAPVVLYVHGGGWRSGGRADEAATRLAPMSVHGITVASADYRLVPAAAFPDQLHDLKGAVRWLRAHGPGLGLPTDRLGVWGASAGADLGSLLALTPGDDEFEGTVGGHLGQAREGPAVVPRVR